jgi:hypothetical protein
MSTPTPTHTCEKRVIPTAGGWRANFNSNGHACGKKAKFNEAARTFRGVDEGEPMWFCGTHAPSQIKAREDKKNEIARNERNRQVSAYDSMKSKADQVSALLGLPLSDGGYNWDISPLTDQGRPTGSYRVSYKVLAAIIEKLS